MQETITVEGAFLLLFFMTTIVLQSDGLQHTIGKGHTWKSLTSVLN